MVGLVRASVPDSRRLLLFVALACVAIAGTVGTASAASPGATIWLRRYDGPVGGTDEATAIAVSSDGSTVFVTGRSEGASGFYGYATLAYDTSTGATIWRRRYKGPADSAQSTAIAVSPDDSTVFVTGRSLSTGSSTDYATRAYDASTGATMWTSRYDGPAHESDEALAIGVSPDGSMVFVTGDSTGINGAFNFATVAYDAASGGTRWAERFTGIVGAAATDLAVSPGGTEVFVTGSDIGRVDNNYATVAYDAATGATVWQEDYNGPANACDSASSIAASPDGATVVVTGTSGDCASNDQDYATVAYDASSGAKDWARRYAGPSTDFDEATAVAISPDGTGVIVTGDSRGASTSWDIVTLRYDASSGATIWRRRYNGAPHKRDVASDVGVSPDGATVFVAGESANGTVGAYKTLAYDAASGTTEWARRYTLESQSGATSLAIDPKGDVVFVTGWSDGPTGADYATIAYAA